MKLLNITSVLFLTFSNVNAAEGISIEVKHIVDQRKVTETFEKAQKRTREKLAELPRPVSFMPRAPSVWRCGTSKMKPAPILIPEKRYFFYSSKRRESWTPITGEHKKQQVWAVDTN